MDGTTSLTAVQYGVGPIGARVAHAAHTRGAKFVGAIDIDPEKIGQDLGAVIGTDGTLGTEITDDAEEALAVSPDIVFHSTVSSLEAASDQLIEAMEAGCNVISTAEELIYPWENNPELADRLDSVGRSNGVSCLGTGINPGFVMDTLPAVLTAPLQSVDSLEITRVQDAGDRRGPLQEKVGAGLDEAAFHSEIVEGAGHIGSTESIQLLAAALDWELDTVDEEIAPVIADEAHSTDHVEIEAGNVAGIRQTATGTIGGEERISLDLQMYVGGEPADTVTIDGIPPISVTVDGGYHGDICTSAIVANTAPRLIDAEDGLRTMVDIPTPSHSPTY